MPQEIRVYSMAVLDLLTCALGGTVLVSFLLIVSMGQTGGGGFPDTYFAIDGGVWIDITDRARKEVDPAILDALLAPDRNELVAAPSTPEGKALDALNALAHEYQVELQVFWRPEAGASPDLTVPRGVDDPLLRVNSDQKDVEPLDAQKAADFVARTESLMLRRVLVDRPGGGKEPRLFVAFLVDAAGFKVAQGWYFAGLSVVKGTGVGRESAAWLRIDSGGRPGSLRLQTHSTFGDPFWPDGLALDDWPLDGFDAEALKDPATARREMTAKGAPDLYLPTWPKGYPPSGSAPAPAGNPVEGLPGSPKFRFFGLDDGVWPPTLLLRHDRSAGLPTAARFPTDSNDIARRPGWHRSDPVGPPGWDDYLPGFRVGEETQP